MQKPWSWRMWNEIWPLPLMSHTRDPTLLLFHNLLWDSCEHEPSLTLTLIRSDVFLIVICWSSRPGHRIISMWSAVHRPSQRTITWVARTTGKEIMVKGWIASRSWFDMRARGTFIYNNNHINSNNNSCDNPLPINVSNNFKLENIPLQEWPSLPGYTYANCRWLQLMFLL